ncbi:unnamed protein product [Urochloa humidicola]
MFAEPPPAKRQKTAPPASGQAAMPGSRMLRQTLFVVMFLVRMSVRISNLTKIRSMIQRYVGNAFRMVSGQIEGLRHEMVRGHRQIEGLRHEVVRGHMEIEGLRNEVGRLSSPCPNCHAHRNTRVEPNQEHATADGSNTNIRLCFQNGLKPPIYTDEKITSENNAAIKLAMFQGDQVVTSGALSQAKIEILVLRGDFSNKCRDNWTEDDFDKHIVQGRDGQDIVLGTAWLTNGEVELGEIRFKEGSCRKKVIMAARVCKSEMTSGRVQEAIMKPVTVLDRRNKPNEKRHPPRLDDELYRLEEISRDGVYHRRLKEAKIYKVEGLLKVLNEDHNKLRKILKMEKQENSWSKLIEHARECVLEDRQELKRYQSEEGDVVLFFNCVHDLIGAAFPHKYVACQRFDRAQKALANKCKRHAYDKLEKISPDFIMKGDIPEPISSSTNVAAAPTIQSVGPSQPIFSANQLPPYQGTGAAKSFPYDEQVTGPTYPSANCDPTIPENLNTHFYQGTGTAENLHQDEHVNGPIYPIPDDMNTHYCQDPGNPLQDQQRTTLPWSQNVQGMMGFPYPIELAGMNFDVYPDSGASTFVQPNFGPHNFPQPHEMASITEHEGPSSSCPDFTGSGHADDFQ